MIATTDPSDMTPEERRAEVAAILAAGYMRLARRPRPPHSSLQDSAQVAATLDGKPLINWRGPPSALSVPETWGGTKLGCLALGAWGSSVAFRDARLKVLSGEAKVLRPAAAAKPPAKP